MKETCIPHPPGERLVLIRTWQVEACGDNHCAAALLNFFEHWHNLKLANQPQAKSLNDVAEKHGEPRAQEESLLQWHTLDALVEGVLGLYGRNLVQTSIKFLESLGFISIQNNPNPSYKWDKTHHYLFHPETVIEWLRANRGLDTNYHPRTPVKSDELEINYREFKNNSSIVEKGTIDRPKINDRSSENNLAIPKIASKIKEIPPDNANALSSPPPDGEGHKSELPKKARKPRTLKHLPTYDPAGYQTFIAAYSLHTALDEAVKAWDWLKPDPDLQALILADIARRKTEHQPWADGYIPHPATYLRGRRWTDDIIPIRSLRTTVKLAPTHQGIRDWLSEKQQQMEEIDGSRPAAPIRGIDGRAR